MKKEKEECVPVKSQHCVQPCSAQLSELNALTAACKLAKEQTATFISAMMLPKRLTITKLGS